MHKLIVGVLMMVSMSVAGWAAQYAAGDKVEILWGGKWYPGAVVEVDGERYKARYDGYSEVWDEWMTTERLRRPEQVPRAPVASLYKPGDRIEAKAFGMWFKGTVTKVEANRVQVHFDDKTEDWIALENVRALTAVEPATQPVVMTRPAGAKTGLEGAFLRVETFYFSGSLSLSNQGWFFSKDGKFSKAPAGGFSFKTFPAGGANSGTYWIANGRITFAFADGSPQLTYEFEDKGDELEWDGLGSTRVEGFKKGWRFEGEYEGGASIGGGALMASTTIVFRRDGTYAHESVASFRSAGNGSVVSGGSQGSGAGTYEFDGFTLTLKPTGEPEKKFTVFAFGDKDREGRPEYIYRDGTMMKRQ